MKVGGLPFSDLHLSDALLNAVRDAGYSEPTAIQAASIPAVLMGRDLIAVAQTGTGKTASFVLPMIDILAEGRSRARMPRSLILEPTRELATQVAENFEQYGKNHKLEMALLIGGVAFGEQNKALEKGVDVLIATPGRLMDQHARGNIILSGVDILVIDEADRMLDMGFIPDIEKIFTLLKPERQTLLFSATMPPPIKKLADQFMTNPRLVEVERSASVNKNIEQFLVPVAERSKRTRLRAMLDEAGDFTAIVFANRKTTVRDLAQSLKRHRYNVGQIHGDMDQRDRQNELERFRNGEINILAASDVAARGLDVKGVSHVFNFDVPWHPDDYVHRIGRTGRAGATGKAYTFVTEADAEAIDNIEKLTGQKIERLDAGQTKTPPKSAEEPRKEAKTKSDKKPAEKRTDKDRADKNRAETAPRRQEGSHRDSHKDSSRADRPARKQAEAAKPRPEKRTERQHQPEVPESGFGEFGPPAFLMISATGKDG